MDFRFAPRGLQCLPMNVALSDFDAPALEDRFKQWGCLPSQARKVLKAYYKNNGLLDLPSLRIGDRLTQRLRQEIPLSQSALTLRRQSADGTVKLLLSLAHGGAVEAVLMPDYRPDRAAGCLSSQIGCAMGCGFCASTARGLERNLNTGEIVEQFLHLRREAHAASRRLNTLVFMGMGEPLLNLDNVIPAVRQITSSDYSILGRRQVTISTVGIVPGIDQLIESGLSVALAVSLHAPDDETRGRLVPINRRWGVAEILAAAKRFLARTGRPVTLGYCMLDGINDSDEQARRLADLLQDFRAHVNLIPHNAIGPGRDGIVYRASPEPRVAAFKAVLRSRGVAVHCRRARGQDIEAACGQLREHAATPPKIQT